jgi:uncharacterized protein with GYD domain
MLMLERISEMAHYLVQFAYTPEAWAVIADTPQGPLEGMRSLIENLGGRLDGAWLTFGEYDAVLICQMPDHISAAAVSLAASVAGSIRLIKTTPMMTAEESLEALKRVAAAAGPQGRNNAAGHTTLPVPRGKESHYRDILSTGFRRFKQKMGDMVSGKEGGR